MEGRTLWLTGRPGAGKTTLARALAERLRAGGTATLVVDGDALRAGLSRDLGFSRADRAENVRRAAEVARLACEQGLVVVVALVSPFDDAREAAREVVGPARFLLVHVDAPLATCRARDPKGLYAAGTPDLSGDGAPYEPPPRADLRLDTSALGVEACVARLLEALG